MKFWINDLETFMFCDLESESRKNYSQFLHWDIDSGLAALSFSEASSVWWSSPFDLSSGFRWSSLIEIVPMRKDQKAAQKHKRVG